jgi:hypothetical protein
MLMRKSSCSNLHFSRVLTVHGHRFLEHPWSNLTDTFLNLEGAASGG